MPPFLFVMGGAKYIDVVSLVGSAFRAVLYDLGAARAFVWQAKGRQRPYRAPSSGSRHGSVYPIDSS